MFPSLVSLEVAAKSFVFPRCSNFIFSRPHKLLRRGYLPAAGFPTEQLLMYGLKAVPFIAIPNDLMDVAEARSVEVRHFWPTNTPVMLCRRQYLDCY
jgi:hypothetical protein